MSAKLRRIELPARIITTAVSEALSLQPARRKDFFKDFRVAVRSQIAQELRRQGIYASAEASISATNLLRGSRCVPCSNLKRRTGWENDIDVELDFEFCAKYGHDDYSLQAINYLDRGYAELPSVAPFLASQEFSLGNLLVGVESGDYEIDIEFGDGLRVTGYCHQITPKKRKSFLCLLGMSFDSSLLSSFAVSGDSMPNDVDELRLGTNSFPFLSICRRSGRLFTCTCFEGHFDTEELLSRFSVGCNKPEIRKAVGALGVRSSICSLCTGRVPRHLYGHSMYYSRFLERYLPYYYLYLSREPRGDRADVEICKNTENRLRNDLGYPSIGKSHLSEIMLYKTVCALFAPMQVIRNYRGRELERLEIDIWIPDIKLAIEFQGEQHYKSTTHWGGEAGFVRRQENDRRKRELCSLLGYQLVEIDDYGNVGEDDVWDLLSPHLIARGA